MLQQPIYREMSNQSCQIQASLDTDLSGVMAIVSQKVRIKPFPTFLISGPVVLKVTM